MLPHFSDLHFALWPHSAAFVHPTDRSRGPDRYPSTGIFFFIFAGQVMNTSGITRRIFDFANVLVRRIPGVSASKRGGVALSSPACRGCGS